MTTKITADNIEQSTLDILEPSGPAVANVKITSNTYTILDDTAVSTDGGYIIVNGSNFEPNVNVLIDQTAATSVTRVSATQLQVQVPALSAGSKILYVVNSDTGATTIVLNGVTCSGTPTWVTGSTLTDGIVDAAISIQLSASSDSNVSYQLQAGSTLPAGLTLAANGLLSGTVTGITVETLYNFTVEAVDAENQDSPRSFTITISVLYKISRSLRFNSADSAYLSRTPASAGNRRTWTWSGWVKRSVIGNFRVSLFTAGADGTEFFYEQSNVADQLKFYYYSNVYEGTITTNAVYRDVSAWYHIVLAVDTTQATSTNRAKIYVNGVQQDSTFGSNFIQNADLDVNNTTAHYIGKSGTGSGFYFNGYLTEINFIDGQALTPSSFGETDADTGVWSPIEYTGSYGTNGFYLDFSDNSGTTSTTLGKDQAGSNNWTPYNFSVAAGAGNDSFVDTPTRYGTDTGVGGEVRGNYATLNPLRPKGVSTTFSNGNLTYINTAETADQHTFLGWSTITSQYYEFTATTITVASQYVYAGESGGYYCSNGQIYVNNSLATTVATYTSGDVLSFAVTVGGIIKFYKNGILVYTSSGTAGGFPICNGLSSSVWDCNFGQRPFAYTAPAGFKALCTTNLPEPTIVDGGEYFNTVLYNGSATTPLNVTGVGFEPDMVWLKSRSAGWTHGIFTKLNGIGVGGGYKYLATNTTAGELDTWGSLTFDSDGWTGVSSSYNGSFAHDFGASGQTFVSWNWNAGGTTVTNTAGSIQSQVRASTTAGFSIVTYTGNGGNAPATIGHGLGVAPQMMILKFRDATSAWSVYHASLGNTKRIRLELTNAADTSTDHWNDTSPTSTVFTVGVNFNQTDVFNYLVYCFAEIEGYSKFGSYTGNGSADGPFVYTGFRPAFIMIKNSSNIGNWFMFDNKRIGYNTENYRLIADSSLGEADPGEFDILSNGFKVRFTSANVNTGGENYIYIAFASNPFKFALAR